MKISVIKEIAKKMGVKDKKSNKIELIRPFREKKEIMIALQHPL